MTIEQAQQEAAHNFKTLVLRLGKHGGGYTQMDAWKVLVLVTLTQHSDWCSIADLAIRVNHRWLLHHPHLLSDRWVNLPSFVDALKDWGLLTILPREDNNHLLQLTYMGREYGRAGRKFVNREMPIRKIGKKCLIKIKRKKGKKSKKNRK